MDKKISREQRHLVEDAKKQIIDLRDQQDEIFNQLTEQLNIESEEDINWIFDFIHNAGQLSDEYYQMVESTIFE
jgi:energy-converting hydrogenase A subunit M